MISNEIVTSEELEEKAADDEESAENPEAND